MEKFKVSIPIIRHFEDVEDLRKHKRDGELIPGQDVEARRIATSLLENIREENKKAVILTCSDKKRAVQTAELIISQLNNMAADIKTRIATNSYLSSIYEGEFILPENYKPGDKFDGLPLANKIFNKEVFESDNPNDAYRFGDPIKLSDNKYKYPELLKYFRSYGENNKEMMTRIYLSILDIYNKFHKLKLNTKIVVVTHAQLYQIFRNLSVVVQKIKNEDIEFDIGDIPRLCWRVYKERSNKGSPSYNINFIPLEELLDEEIVNLLEKELEYIKSVNTSFAIKK